jgi:biopolymer transport protein ExbD
MSASTSHDKCEPNLTPMLDMVLQLVMFFMLCANFLMEELNKAVQLPEAVTAKPLDKGISRTIFINLTVDDPKTGTKRALSTNQGPVKEVHDNANQLKRHLEGQFAVDQKKTPPADWAAGKGRTLLILRADYRATFKEVNEVMQACKSAGYSDISLRANQKGTEK